MTFRWPEPATVRVGEGPYGPIDLAVHELGEGPAVVFCHGFPELAYSWRHQLGAVADAGYRAIAPDMRGYGGSSRPHDVAAYRIDELCADLVGMLDALGLEKATFVGHDWGGFVVWAMPLLHPERVEAVVGVCTPYTSMPTTDFLRSVFTNDEDLYILWFQEDGVAEARMDPNVAPLFQRMLRRGMSPEAMAARFAEVAAANAGRPQMNPFMDLASGEAVVPMGDDLVTDDEMAVYVDTYSRTGFRGGINWYRNIDANTKLLPGVGSADLPIPCLMLTALWDVALRPETADPMMQVLSDVERHDIDEAGHWVQQEQPQVLNGHLIDWLDRRIDR